MCLNIESLDIGCGIHGDADVNLDVRKTRTCNLIASAEYLPFRENTFKTAFCHQVLEHLKNPIIALKEINRILNVRGIATINVPNKRFANNLKQVLLREIFNFPILLRTKEWLWLYSSLKGVKRQEPQYFHRFIVERKVIERHLNVIREKDCDPVCFIFFERGIEKILGVRINFALLNMSKSFRCKKKGVYEK